METEKGKTYKYLRDKREAPQELKDKLKEFNRIKTDISEREVRFAKSSIILKYPSLFETYGQIVRNLANIVVHSLPDNYFNNYVNNIKNVKFQEVLNAAFDNISTEDLVILTVGERDKILPQLNSLNLGEVIELDDDGSKL